MRLSVAVLLSIFVLGLQLACGVPTATRKEDKPTCNQQCRGTQEYDVTFHFRWDEKSGDPGYPSGAYFSAPFAVPHNKRFHLFEEHQNASAGIEAFARDGEFTALKDELKNFRESKVAPWKWGGSERDRFEPVSDVKISKLQLQDKGGMFKISTVVKLGPSPDWFLGALEHDMCDYCTGKWIEKIEPPVYLFDAGVVDGKSYIVSTQRASEPRGSIEYLNEDKTPRRDDQDKDIFRFATLVIEQSGSGVPAWKVVVATLSVIVILLIIWKCIIQRFFRKGESEKESVVEVW